MAQCNVLMPFYVLNQCRLAAVKLHHCEQLPHNSVVQGLRDTLHSAIAEIKSLKEENKALKEQIGLLGSRKMEVSQLQEWLKQKDDLLKRITQNKVGSNYSLCGDGAEEEQPAVEEKSRLKQNWTKTVQEMEKERGTL